VPLLGPATLLLSFDIVPEAISEHDEWHSHEHLPERLSIPGFLRGTRWVAARATPRYFVLYEVAGVSVLTSGAYLERLNNPTSWTTRMMQHYRGMSRGLCSVSGSFGDGVGHYARLVRFAPRSGAAEGMRKRLLEGLLPAMPKKRGICSAHLLERAAAPAMTKEQRIRGADAGVDWAILVTGYEEAAIANLDDDAAPPAWPQAGECAADILDATYRVAHSLSHDERK
jgi:hypothetical protein